LEISWQPPPPSQIWRAIELYLEGAYDGSPPLAVRARLEILRSTPTGAFYQAAPFEKSPADIPNKYSLRLGNRSYPHMKLVIEKAPDGRQTLFRADTHDRHVQLKPDSPEARAFADLSRLNQEIAQRIEKNWEEEGLMTFKKFLRDDLQRRKAANDAGGGH